MSGNSFLRNDRDFGAIEVAAKKKQIFLPSDWYSSIIASSAKRRNKMIVCEMTKDNFCSKNQLKSVKTKIKKNTSNELVNWLHMQHIHYEKQLPFQVLYKETLTEFEDFKELNLSPARMQGRPRLLYHTEQTLHLKKPFSTEQIELLDAPLTCSMSQYCTTQIVLRLSFQTFRF